MKLSKKLLATLLPITAASTLAPVLSSCNKGSGYVINYGDEIECLDEKAKNYHSLDEVKNSVKSHTSICQSKKISADELPDWDEATGEVKQSMYYDLIASVANLANTKFHLTWTISEATYAIKLVLASGENSGTSLQYNKASTGNSIVIEIVKDSQAVYSTKSYNFQNTEIGE